MSRAVSAERPKSSGRTYTDEEWESVKDRFHYYYMEKNMSLKEAAKCMSENHGFDATLRQWERRIAPEKWGFSKYASRDDRLKAIDASGKSLLDVSQRGRRKSTASDGRPSLTEDRNLRRFARREVSRESRHRARSVSVLSDQSDQDMSDHSGAPSPAASDLMMETQDSASYSQPAFDMFGSQWTTNVSQDSTMGLPEIRIFDQSRNSAVPAINIMGPEDTYIAPEQIPILKVQETIQYPLEDNANSFDTFHSRGPDGYISSQSLTNSYDQTTGREGISSSFQWPGSYSSQSEPHDQKPNQNFATFAYENDPSISFTDMLQLSNQDSENAATSINISGSSFDVAMPRSQNEPSTSDPDLEINPDFDDPTYVDCFALIKERDNRIMQMISMLKQTYQSSANTQHTTKDVLNKISILEQGIQAQNNESERDVRRTLKNISSTQRRATQDIHILSTQRRRKIEQLQRQLDGLTASQHQSYSFG